MAIDVRGEPKADIRSFSRQMGSPQIQLRCVGWVIFVFTYPMVLFSALRGLAVYVLQPYTTYGAHGMYVPGYHNVVVLMTLVATFVTCLPTAVVAFTWGVSRRFGPPLAIATGIVVIAGVASVHGEFGGPYTWLMILLWGYPGLLGGAAVAERLGADGWVRWVAPCGTLLLLVASIVLPYARAR